MKDLFRVLAVIVASFVSVAACAQTYRLIDLEGTDGTWGSANGINNAGQVVGTIMTDLHDGQAFLSAMARGSFSARSEPDS